MTSGTVEQSQHIVTLDNGKMKLTIRPDLGGRIDQLQDCKTGREWLWHPENYDAAATRSLPVGASFDANWTGGWDEIFPNDVAGEFRGRQLADHGELWSQAWTIEETIDLSLTLQYQCQTMPVLVEKMIELDEDAAEARIIYRLQNQSDDSIPFLLKQHAAIAIAENDEILLPDCLIEPVVLDFSKIIGQERLTQFPKAFDANGKQVDISKIPARSSNLQEFFYSSNLADGWCGIRHEQTQSALKMRFDRADFPYVWVFQSYGGWNGHYVLIMEPSTTIPYDLDAACKNGTAAYLHPQEVQYRTINISLES